jgi:hypothetical protein
LLGKSLGTQQQPIVRVIVHYVCIKTNKVTQF